MKMLGSNKNVYRWNFSTNINMGKRTMAAILTQNNEPVYVYAICPKNLKGSDIFSDLDKLVAIADRYNGINKIPNLEPPSFSPLEIVSALKDPENVHALNGKSKRLRYSVLFNILKKMPDSKNATTITSKEIIRSLSRFQEFSISSKTDVNRPIKTSKTAETNIKNIEKIEKKKNEAKILIERIKKGEEMQNEWVSIHGGKNMGYESLLNKLRFELSKLDASSIEYKFTDDDNRKYAWAWELIEKGPDMTDYEFKRLSRSMKNDPKLDSWIFHHPRTPIRATMDDIARLFGGKIIDKHEVEYADHK